MRSLLAAAAFLVLPACSSPSAPPPAAPSAPAAPPPPPAAAAPEPGEMTDADADAVIAEMLAEGERAERAKTPAQRAEDDLRRSCGGVLGRVHVGEEWARAERCAGPWRLTYEDAAARVYEGAAGAVRVERGRVTRIVQQ